MKQLGIFEESVKIAGLSYIKEYINEDLEKELLNIIDFQPWNNDLKRRTQHYGYKYDYTRKTVYPSLYIGEIPQWLYSICKRLQADGVFPQTPNQVIINEYQVGQGISPHIDCIPCFTETICSLSLLSNCMIEFTKDTLKESINLAPRSLLVLKDEARYKWKHGILPRKTDIGIERKRRISLTFRRVKE